MTKNWIDRYDDIPKIGLLESNTPPSESGPNMCDKSPNTRHLWISLGIGEQSIETFKCKHCGDVIYD